MSCDPDWLPSILDSLAEGKPWKGTVRVHESLLDCPSKPLDKNMHTSHSDLFVGMSRCNTTLLCSQGLDTSDSTAQAPKLRWLMDAMSSRSPDVGSELEASHFSAARSCNAFKPRYGRGSLSQHRSASSRITQSNYQSFELDESFGIRAAPAAASSAIKASQHIRPPTVLPAIAPPAPVLAGRSLHPPNLSHRSINPETMRLIFPHRLGQPRFDENSVMAALDNPSGMSQLLATLQSQGSTTHHRSQPIMIPGLHSIPPPLTETALDVAMEANMDFSSGLIMLTELDEVRVVSQCWYFAGGGGDQSEPSSQISL
jgi:hypothetical protein